MRRRSTPPARGSGRAPGTAAAALPPQHADAASPPLESLRGKQWKASATAFQVLKRVLVVIAVRH